MKRRLSSVLAALALIFVFTGTVSAHTASAKCEKVVITNTPEGHPAYIYDGHNLDGVLLFGPVGNGTYDVPYGVTFVIWPAWDQNGQQQGKGINYKVLEVPSCPIPTPTPTPTSTPTSTPTPTPTPSPTPTPTPSVTPTPTPTPTPSSTPDPSPSFTPQPSSIPTPPPTDTSPSGGTGTGLDIGLFVLAVVASVGFLIGWTRVRALR